MNVNIQLGMRIKYLRIQNAWSQEDLAFEAEINKNYLSDLERGTRNPTLKIIEKIASAFKISISELCKGISTFSD
ncbi:HTH-type transcriptional regulator DdrOP3 [bioreactor metagenome]|uniref:HTH-type transcriptional regulator DdrOP3 n=1 Tax=bioreactor metagenome TaxID=1076179 RepID=A0A645A7Q2_9ZZZZ|nr:helix-turn-helix transcriptional regulator [Erysipelotrichaceae bacterium]